MEADADPRIESSLTRPDSQQSQSDWEQKTTKVGDVFMG
jgi:hypothetical protein